VLSGKHHRALERANAHLGGGKPRRAPVIAPAGEGDSLAARTHHQYTLPVRSRVTSRPGVPTGPASCVAALAAMIADAFIRSTPRARTRLDLRLLSHRRHRRPLGSFFKLFRRLLFRSSSYNCAVWRPAHFPRNSRLPGRRSRRRALSF
jgi:hypothetical protein